jgi:methyl-accepting chemotaxis protein
MFKNMQMGIGKQLSIIVSAIILALLVMIFILVNGSSKDMALNMSDSMLSQNAKTVSTTIENWLEEKIRILGTLSTNPSLSDTLNGGDPTEAVKHLKAAKALDNNLESIFLHNSEGTSVATTAADGIGKNYKNKGYFSTIIVEGKETYISDVELSPTSNQPRIAICRVIRDGSGKTLGYVGMSVLSAAFTQSFINPIKVGENGYAFMLDESGKVVAHPNSELIFKDLSNLEFIRESLNRKTGFMDYEFKGDEKYMAFAEIPLTGWIVALSAEQSDMLVEARAMQRLLIIIGVVGLLGG